MKIFLILFFVVITAFAFLNVLLILGSSHSFGSIDIDYRIVAFSSLILFPVTGIYAYKELVTHKDETTSDAGVTRLFLVLTAIIFGYYSFELLRDEYSDGVSFYNFLPLVIFLLTIALIIKLTAKIRKTWHGQ